MIVTEGVCYTMTEEQWGNDRAEGVCYTMTEEQWAMIVAEGGMLHNGRGTMGQ